MFQVLRLQESVKLRSGTIRMPNVLLAFRANYLRHPLLILQGGFFTILEKKVDAFLRTLCPIEEFSWNLKAKG